MPAQQEQLSLAVMDDGEQLGPLSPLAYHFAHPLTRPCAPPPPGHLPRLHFFCGDFAGVAVAGCDR
jgi:hypothetical protein